MLQRVVIAMALATDPALLILDEPTTGLDATVEAEVLDLVSHLRERLGTSVLFISHNLGIIANMCDRVGVLYAGRLVEEGPAREVFQDPRHPYAVGLLRCLPRAGVRKDEGRLDTIPGTLPPIGAQLPGASSPTAAGSCSRSAASRSRTSCAVERHAPQPLPLLARGAHRPPHDAGRRPWPHRRGDERVGADPRGRRLEDVQAGRAGDPRADRRRSRPPPGETLGLVGESGSGKTTFARVVLGLTKPDEGSSWSSTGQPLSGGLHRPHARSRCGRSRSSSRTRTRRSTGAPACAASSAGPPTGCSGCAAARSTSASRRSRRACACPSGTSNAKPYQLSGGLKQRVAIARAFAGDAARRGVRRADLRPGRLGAGGDPQPARRPAGRPARRATCSSRTTSASCATCPIASPCCTSGTCWSSATPSGSSAARTIRTPRRCSRRCRPSRAIERKRIRLAGEIPSAAHLPSGCVFHSRCPRKKSALCETEQPPLVEKEPGHWMRCHWTLEELAELQKTAPEGQPEVPPI